MSRLDRLTKDEKIALSGWLTVGILLLCVGGGGMEFGFWGALEGAGLGLILIVLYDIFLEDRIFGIKK